MTIPVTIQMRQVAWLSVIISMIMRGHPPDHAVDCAELVYTAFVRKFGHV